MFIASINWNEVAALAGVAVAVLYPPLGLFYRWIKYLEKRFDELQDGIDDLRSNDTVDVANLKAFEEDMGRRMERVENKLWT